MDSRTGTNSKVRSTTCAVRSSKVQCLTVTVRSTLLAASSSKKSTTVAASPAASGQSFFDLWFLVLHDRASLEEHLGVFLGNPAVDLDNNRTERALRGVVLGRKNMSAATSVPRTEREP